MTFFKKMMAYFVKLDSMTWDNIGVSLNKHDTDFWVKSKKS